MNTDTTMATGIPVPGLSKAAEAIRAFTSGKSRKIDEIILHCSATPIGRDVRCADIRRWHINDRKFTDIGYHFVITIDGIIEIGRPLRHAGAHCLGHNRHSIGICYVGGLDNNGNAADTRTQAQHHSLHAIISLITRLLPGIRIHGHRDFAPKECPCFDATTEYATLFPDLQK